MKTKVPFIPDLEKMPVDKLNEVLEIKSQREYLSHAPWPEFSYKPVTSVDLAASEDYFFARFFVRGWGLKAEYATTNDPVWQDSCVEIFIEDPENEGYRNFEVNCIGTLLSSRQRARGVEVKRIEEGEAEKIIRIPSLPPTTFSEKDGIHEWSMIIGIPFSILGGKKRPEILRANFYKCADGCRFPHYVSWSPIDNPSPNFHLPQFFGMLQFEPVNIK